ncbi:extracellular solute-binding protein [Paenibacillus chitinolyticus]|uniref:extracellular solute-binding protein n=1 Tax=Paenibacillus chitinolyticus TaxID=79263 RepID=UPI0035DE1010
MFISSRLGNRSLCPLRPLALLRSSLLLGALAAASAGCEHSPETAGGGFIPTGSASPADSISIVTNAIGMSFPQGLDENNNPYLRYIEKNTGLNIKVTLPPQDVYPEKLNVIMASGNTPDLINYSDKVWMNDNARQNKLMPLDELIDRYGKDLKEKIPKEAWDQVTVDGKIYAVPSLNEVKGLELMYVRKDWLDRLGLAPPVTLDDYYKVIRAFTLDDPDGNGINDTIGLTFGESLVRSAPFFGAFGVQLDQWTDRYGELAYTSTLPETKEALAFLRKLYREKLLDPEFPLNRNPSMMDKIKNGKVGLFSAAWYDTRGPIAANMQKDPRAVWIPLEFPRGPEGHSGVYATSLVRSYNVIPVESANPEGVIRYLNFIAGDGYKTLKLGFENEIWSMQNGKMVINFEEHNKHLYRGIYQAMEDVQDKETSKIRLDALGDFHLYDNLKRIEGHLIPNAFYGSPTPSMSKYYNIKGKELMEHFVRIIVGVEPLDSFEMAVERWRKEGGDDMTREVNEWYKKQGIPQGAR